MKKKSLSNIEQFITLFSTDDKYMNGLCYWFAYILKGRFPNGDIWYEPIMNHFYFVIDDAAFDVRGQVELPGTAIRWNEYENFDPLHYQRIVKYCILKEDN